MKAGWNQFTAQWGSFQAAEQLVPRRIIHGATFLVTALAFANGGLAAPARPLLNVLAGQIRYLGPLQGASAGQVNAREREIAAERTRFADAGLAHPPKSAFMGAPQSFWASLRDDDQVAVAKSLMLPILILHGGNDYQVSPTQDFDAWKKALGGEPNVSFHLFPGPSHVFMPGPTRSPVDYDKPARVAPVVIETIVNWINAQSAECIATPALRARPEGAAVAPALVRVGSNHRGVDITYKFAPIPGNACGGRDLDPST